MLTTEERLSTGQAARLAGVSVQTIGNWIRTGLLPYEQTPLGRLVRMQDLDQIIAAREATRVGTAAGRHSGRRAGDALPSVD